MQIFPLANERSAFYARLLWYGGIGSGTFLSFWFWDLIHTGEAARDSWEWPRLFDAPAVIVWVAVLAIVARLVEYAHTHPFKVQASDFTKSPSAFGALFSLVLLRLVLLPQLLLYSTPPVFIILGVLDVWKGGVSIAQMVLGYSVAFIAYVLVYGLMTHCLRSLHRFFDYFGVLHRHRK